MITPTHSLWLFNPDHDLALGANELHYIAPAAIRQMEEDLALLPLWYAPAGGAVEIANEQLAHSFVAHLGLKPEAIVAKWGSTLYNKVYPWGWNKALTHTLLQRGVSVQLLPTQDELFQIRNLSGRLLAVEVLQELGRWATGATSVALYSMESVAAFVSSHSQVILKAPWSGSGKGLRFATGCFDQPLQGWVKRTLALQQYVVCEPFYQKVVDFAMEFESLNGVVRFVGYSIFETDSKGSYQRSLLESNKMLEERLSLYLPEVAFGDLQQQLELILTAQVAAHYQGYLGVDMMICQEVGGSYWLHPCVEINLRMNMGVVARLFYDRYVTPGSKGYYGVTYQSAPSALLQQSIADEGAYPLQLVDNRIKSGYFSLTPVTAATHYQAYVVLYT
ncbi:MAG: hypothetical protein ACRCUJ_04350 [Phocaeicola sp.]